MHPILFFDGYCHLCDGMVQRLIKMDKKRILRYAPLDGVTAASLLPVGEKPDSLLLLYKGEVYFKSGAVLKIAQLLGWPMKLLYAGYIIPRNVRDYIYDYFARHRYRWFSRRESCRLPEPGEMELFLP